MRIGGWLGSILRFLLRIVFFLAVLLSAIWIGFALYFQLPLADPLKWIALGAWALFAVAVLFSEIVRPRMRGRILYGLAIVIFAVWWSTLQPSNDLDWQVEVAHGVTGMVDGSRVTLRNVRDFDWRSDTDFTERWETRSYDLDTIQSVDLVLGYWMGPEIAHTIISFGFSDGQRVAFSAEIRPTQTQEFSTLAGFFRVFNLVLIAADERDVIFLRTNIRHEDVYLYPLDMPKPAMRELFLSFVQSGNRLAQQPKFYNTLTANCTTVVFRLIRALDPGLPIDYRILLSGFLPDYVFELQGYRTGLTLQEFRARARVSELGIANGDSAGFSAAIRPPDGLSGIWPVDKP